MSLVDRISSIIENADIDAGVAIWHIESGARLDVNGDLPFPMASTFKIPILATACKQLAEGVISLDARVPLVDEDKSMGSGILPYFESGLQPTVRDLLTLMIIISDNTATDILVDYLGGAAVIEGYMHELGLTDIFFKLNCKELLRHALPPEVADLPRDELVKWTTENDILRDGLPFSKGPENNVSTAKAMNALLHLMHSDLFRKDVRAVAFDILHKQQFTHRIARFLPLGVKVASKTGTIGGIRNDCGIIRISESNHVIVSLFVEWDEAPYWNKPAAHHQRVFDVETAMGEIGRAVYDEFARLD
ncbi:MAG: class A beta-lactamase-related serine hydrolase [Chloroflexi bacterium]|nr:class A beta-lactamase-related serine hydrolase [Chloroflexota bacterium]